MDNFLIAFTVGLFMGLIIARRIKSEGIEHGSSKQSRKGNGGRGDARPR